jgi:hypothetical protein
VANILPPSLPSLDDETIKRIQSQSLHTVMAGQEQGKVEAFYYNMGVWIAQHDREIIGCGLILLLIGCSFWQFAELETDVGKLLIAGDGRVREQLDYVDEYGIDKGDGFSAVFVSTANDGGDVRTVDALLEHLDVARSIHDIEIEYKGETFNIFDVGQFPGADNGQPLRISPLDCFQEGSYDWTRVHSEQYKFATIDRQFPSYHNPDYHDLSSYSSLIGSLVGEPNAVLEAYNGCLFLKVAEAFGMDFNEYYLGRCRKYLANPLTLEEPPASIVALQKFYSSSEGGPAATPEKDLAKQQLYGVNWDSNAGAARTHNFCACAHNWTLDGDDTVRYGCDGYIDFADKRRPAAGTTQLAQSYSVLEKQYWCYIEDPDGICGNPPMEGDTSGGRWDTCTTWAWDVEKFVTTDEELLDVLTNVQCGAWDGGETGFNTIPWVREVVVGTSLEREDRSAIQTIYFTDDKEVLLKRWKRARKDLHLGPDFGRSVFGIQSSGSNARTRDGLMAHKAMVLQIYDAEFTVDKFNSKFRFLDVANQFLEAADYNAQPWLVTPLDCFQEGGTSAAMVPASVRRVLGIEGAKQAITDILGKHDSNPDTFDVYLTPYNWCIFADVLKDQAQDNADLQDFASSYPAVEGISDNDAAMYLRWLDGDGDGVLSEEEATLDVLNSKTKFGNTCRPFLFDPTTVGGDKDSIVSPRVYRYGHWAAPLDTWTSFELHFAFLRVLSPLCLRVLFAGPMVWGGRGGGGGVDFFNGSLLFFETTSIGLFLMCLRLCPPPPKCTCIAPWR